jgi:DNA-binding FadR family transcriptional regulator
MKLAGRLARYPAPMSVGAQPAGFTPVKVLKAAELVAMQLRKSIARGDLAAGTFLPAEAVLMERFAVSRPTLREAIRVLESEGLIEVRRGSRGGARIHPPNGDVAARHVGLVLEYRKASLADVFTAVAAIEAPVVGALARSRSAAALKRLRAAVEAEESATDPAAEIAAQNAFHHLLLELHGNETLTVLAEMLRHIIDRATQRALERAGLEGLQAGRHQGHRTHRRTLELIDARDDTGAEELWTRHIRETARFLGRELGPAHVVDLLD